MPVFARHPLYRRPGTDFVRDLARQRAPLTEMDVRNLHRLVVLRSKPDIAGRYADQGRYVLTDSGRHSFPSPTEVPALMGDFSGWLGAAADTPESAFSAHRRLVEIHPFDDGNGRTARVEAGEPQRNVARSCNVSQPTIWRLAVQIGRG